jgi:hypothetical protein
VRVFNGLASSGQLSTRSIVVSQVFDFVFVNGGAVGSVFSAIDPRAYRRKGFHRESFTVVIMVGVLRYVMPYNREDVVSK